MKIGPETGASGKDRRMYLTKLTIGKLQMNKIIGHNDHEEK